MEQKKNGKYIEDDAVCWYKNGLLHREDGPAIICNDGTQEWYIEGARHREDGAAIEYADGDKQWFMHGIPHRLDGPALDWKNSLNEQQWWIWGNQYTEEQFNNFLKERALQIQSWADLKTKDLKK